MKLSYRANPLPVFAALPALPLPQSQTVGCRVSLQNLRLAGFYADDACVVLPKSACVFRDILPGEEAVEAVIDPDENSLAGTAAQMLDMAALKHEKHKSDRLTSLTQALRKNLGRYRKT